MKNKESKPGDRLREEITRVFGSLQKAADAIEVKSGSYFRPYLNNSSSIGMLLQKKLVDIGLDVEYIMEGKGAAEAKESSDEKEVMIRKFEDLRYRSDQLHKEIEDFGEKYIKPMKNK